MAGEVVRLHAEGDVHRQRLVSRRYPLLSERTRRPGTQGVANADGSLNTRWQCYAPDPEGTYTMTIRDEVTGETATARFFVDQPD